MIYEISDSLDIYPIHSMYSGDLDAHEGKEFNRTKKADDSEIKQVTDLLKHHGFQIGYATVDVGPDEKEIPYFVSTTMAKKNYFHARFKQFKKLAENMTLDEFATSVSTIQSTIEETFSDAVYHNTAFDTFDNFIRNTQPGVKYYIGYVYEMYS